MYQNLSYRLLLKQYFFLLLNFIESYNFEVILNYIG